jgi:hypothetical protein
VIDPHYRLRTDKIDTSGTITLRHDSRLHHIGLGRRLAGTRVYVLAADLHIRVVGTETGELLRELTLDPSRDYQPTGRPPGPPRNGPECNDVPRHLSTVSRDITFVGPVGLEPTTRGDMGGASQGV